MAFLLIAVTLGADIAISGVQNLSYGRLGASTLERLWGTMGAAGRTCGGPEQDSLVILE